MVGRGEDKCLIFPETEHVKYMKLNASPLTFDVNLLTLRVNIARSELFIKRAGAIIVRNSMAL